MFLIAIGLAGLLFGVGSSEVRRFENAAARDISSRLLGVSKQVKVRIKFDPFQAIGGRLKSGTITASNFVTEGLPLFTQPEGSKRGRLDELKISLAEFELTGLQVKKLEARIPNCRFDFGLAQKKGQIRLTKSGIGTGSVEIDQRGLLKYISQRHPTLKNVQLQLLSDQIQISGTGRFMAFEAYVQIQSRLHSPDGSTIQLVDAEVLINGEKAVPLARDAVLKVLNPVVDLNRDLKLFGALTIDSVTVGANSLMATGRAHIPDHPLGTWINRIGLFFP
ncbi:MAG: DUF2993 domain-containing protein [Chlorobia bacterium]|nr:DUF2993 domain-containing protein [Fimbriimonadaceae bacterium]